LRVSEKVTIDHINSWNPGDIITIKAGTGVGKSYFIKNNLYAIVRKQSTKILFLLHRTNCVNQFRSEILADKKENTIHIVTYQHIETLLKKGKSFDYSPYQYIVCDEFHYFMSDAAFNKTTDISLNSILEQTQCIRLFMSATGNYMKSYISTYKKLPTIDYELPINFSFIKSLTFYNKDSTLDIFIKEAIEKQQKGIFFIQSVEKAYQFYLKYKDYCLFNCSKNNEKGYYKYVDQNKIDQMLANEKFDELILITTTCLDTGVNIIDEQLKHIVCDIFDIGTIVQCIGRKRLSKEDNHVNVYIKSINNQQLGGHETSLKNRIKKAKYLIDHTPTEYVNEYLREYDDNYIVYDEVIEGDKITKKVNWLMYFKSLIDVSAIQAMKEYKFGYTKSIANKLGKGSDYRLIEEVIEQRELDSYLESMLGKIMLQSKDRKQLIEKINVRDGNNNRLLKSLDILNCKLKEDGYDFIIDQFKTSRTIDDKKINYKAAWRVRRLSDK
jgi:guanylate kinase